MMKILLIEDDPFFQKFYSYKLKEQQFEVDIAKDGVEGLEKLQQEVPNLVLLDLIMPNKDGFEVLSDMSQNPTLKRVPVLVFSTLSQEQDVKKAMEMGAIGYVNKSFFDFETLLTKIKSIASQQA